MLKKINRMKFLWFFIALLTLIASLAGIANPNLYNTLMNPGNLSEVMSQDIFTILAAITMLFLILKLKETDIMKQIIILGLTGFLFYGYGLYVMERIYNILYFVYMVIFSLSLFALIDAMFNIRKEIYLKVKVPKTVRNLAVVFLFLVPLIFFPIRITTLWPLMQVGQKIESGYSIFILDMCLILPLLIITGIMILKKEGLALLLTPVLTVKTIGWCGSVALGGVLKLWSGQTADWVMTGLSLFLTLAGITVTLIYFKNIRINGDSL